METSPPAPTHRPNEGGGVMDIAAEGTAVVRKKRKNWGQNDTDDLFEAVSNTKKQCIRLKQGASRVLYWDEVAKMVPGRAGDECRGRMDTLKKSFRKINIYCGEEGKKFYELKENDFLKMKVSPPLTEEWYNQIRDYCPPKKKLKRNGAGTSSKISGFASDSSTSGLQRRLFSDGIDQGEPTSMDPPASLEPPVSDPIQEQAPPASPDWTDLIDSYDCNTRYEVIEEASK